MTTRSTIGRMRGTGRRSGGSGEAGEADVHLRSALDTLAMPGLVLGLDGRVLHANDALLAILGRSRPEVVGRDWFESFVPAWDRRSARERLLRLAVAGEIPGHDQGGVVALDGNHHIVEWNYGLVRDAAGRPGALYLIGARVAEPGTVEHAREATARRAAEAALSESEARFRAAFEENPETISIFRPIADETGRLVDAEVLFENRIGRERYFDGAPLDELVGAKLFEGWPQYRALLFDQFAEVVALGRPVHREIHGTRSDGDFWSQTWAFPFEGGFVHVGRDVTAERRALEALRQADEQLHRRTVELEEAREIAGLGIFHRDLDSGIVSWSPQMFRIFGLDPSGPVPTEDEVAAAYTPESRERIRRVLDPEGPPLEDWEFDLELRRPDGELRRIWQRGVLQRDDGGNLTGYLGTSMDVTEQRRSDSEIKLLAAATEQSTDSIAMLDRNARITYVNPSFERATGYSEAEVLGQRLSILRSGVHSREFYDAMKKALEDGTGWTADVTNRRKDGSLFTEQTTLSPIRDDSGVVTGFVTVKHDVTAQRELEARLRQSERLEAVGRLAGGVAHDFNNLLAAIRGYAELARTDIGPGSTADDLTQIILASDRAATLTRQLLAFSRQQVLEMRVVDPGSVVEPLLPMLRRLLGEHIELVTDSAADLGRVKADAGQLEQVIVNLAVNARDAMPEGGRLAIELSNVAPGETSPGRPGVPDAPMVRLRVTDTGIGMDTDTLGRVFEPFFTTKGLARGTGMGLASVLGIVQQSGGLVWATSQPGRGSVFTIDLPRVDGPEIQAAPPSAPAAQGGAETILLVEDEPGVRTFVARALRNLGYAVLEASSGAEALELTGGRDVPVDLLLTDVTMPGIQGPDLARRVKALQGSVAVMFMSGYLEDPDSLAAGAILLAKPFDPATLARAVRTALGGGSRS
jgi:two-component system, cell cycle sensor histidine kinase and response regulator CckA